jgi:hypothetical protein
VSEHKLIDGKVLLRPHDDGSFDELVLYDENGKCIVHAEMMDGCTLWIGFYPPGEPERRVVMWIASKNKLRIRAEED